MKFHVSYFVDSRPIGQVAKPIVSPLCQAYVELGLKDLLVGIARGRLRVTIVMSGDDEAGLAISDLVAAAGPPSDASLSAASRRVTGLKQQLREAQARFDELLDGAYR